MSLRTRLDFVACGCAASSMFANSSSLLLRLRTSSDSSASSVRNLNRRLRFLPETSLPNYPDDHCLPKPHSTLCLQPLFQQPRTISCRATPDAGVVIECSNASVYSASVSASAIAQHPTCGPTHAGARRARTATGQQHRNRTT